MLNYCFKNRDYYYDNDYYDDDDDDQCELMGRMKPNVARVAE